MRKPTPTRQQTPRELELLDRLSSLLNEQSKTNAENMKLLTTQIELMRALLVSEQEIICLQQEVAALKKQLVSRARKKPPNASFTNPTFFSPAPRNRKHQTPLISDKQYARLCSRT